MLLERLGYNSTQNSPDSPSEVEAATPLDVDVAGGDGARRGRRRRRHSRSGRSDAAVDLGGIGIAGGVGGSGGVVPESGLAAVCPVEACEDWQSGPGGAAAAAAAGSLRLPLLPCGWEYSPVRAGSMPGWAGAPVACIQKLPGIELHRMRRSMTGSMRRCGSTSSSSA